MIEWYRMIGGVITTKEWHNHRGHPVIQTYVQYGRSKPCHYYLSGADFNGYRARVRLQFHGDDAATASAFIMKFFDNIVSTNLREQMERAAEGYITE
jgi:hypothetical protein